MNGVVVGAGVAGVTLPCEVAGMNVNDLAAERDRFRSSR